MFSSVESCRTNRANNRLVASSIMAIKYSFSPRPSSQSCSLVSHCTNSPKRLRRGPGVDLLDLLLLPPPQFAAHHPLPHGLLARLDLVLLPQVFRRQRRPEPPVHIRRQDLHSFFLDGLFDPPVRRLAAQPVNHDFVAPLLQRVQQPLHLSYAQLQLRGCLPLREPPL